MEERLFEELVWNGIKMKVSCICEWPINDFCHIEIRSDGPNPITKAGYRSHFMKLEYLDEYNTYVDYVRAWLDEAAQSKEWKQHVEQARQGTLFDL
jgi:hypothetical protein